MLRLASAGGMSVVSKQSDRLIRCFLAGVPISTGSSHSSSSDPSSASCTASCDAPSSSSLSKVSMMLPKSPPGVKGNMKNMHAKKKLP